MNLGVAHEAHVSTEQPPSQQDARLPRAHEDDRRPEHSEAPPRKGSPQDLRIKGPSKARFEEIFARGKRASGPLGRVSALRPGTGLVGIATAKKIGGKPQRNRARRRFREAVRLQSEIVRPAFDFVIVVNQTGADAPFERIQEEVRRLFGEAVNRWADELESS